MQSPKKSLSANNTMSPITSKYASISSPSPHTHKYSPRVSSSPTRQNISQNMPYQVSSPHNRVSPNSDQRSSPKYIYMAPTPEKEPKKLTPLANALLNLDNFSKVSKLSNLRFDDNLTCVIGVEKQFTIMVTYDKSTERLYLYSTIMSFLPQNTELRLKLYEELLSGALLGRRMAGGGIGVSKKHNLIVMSTSVDMMHSDGQGLCSVVTPFVDNLEQWRSKIQEITHSYYSPRSRSKIYSSSTNISRSPSPGGGRTSPISRYAYDNRHHPQSSTTNNWMRNI